MDTASTSTALAPPDDLQTSTDTSPPSASESDAAQISADAPDSCASPVDMRDWQEVKCRTLRRHEADALKASSTTARTTGTSSGNSSSADLPHPTATKTFCPSTFLRVRPPLLCLVPPLLPSTYSPRWASRHRTTPSRRWRDTTRN